MVYLFFAVQKVAPLWSFLGFQRGDLSSDICRKFPADIRRKQITPDAGVSFLCLPVTFMTGRSQHLAVKDSRYAAAAADRACHGMHVDCYCTIQAAL